jgi:hypothetical protein
LQKREDIVVDTLRAHNNISALTAVATAITIKNGIRMGDESAKVLERK